MPTDTGDIIRSKEEINRKWTYFIDLFNKGIGKQDVRVVSGILCVFDWLFGDTDDIAGEGDV